MVVFGNCYEMTLVAYAVTPYNTCQLTHATCQATCGDIMADEPTVERSYVVCTTRGFCIYKESEDAQFHIARPIYALASYQ